MQQLKRKNSTKQTQKRNQKLRNAFACFKLSEEFSSHSLPHRPLDTHPMMYAKYRKYVYWIFTSNQLPVMRAGIYENVSCAEMSFSAWENIYCVNLLSRFTDSNPPQESKFMKLDASLPARISMKINMMNLMSTLADNLMPFVSALRGTTKFFLFCIERKRKKAKIRMRNKKF